MLLGAAFVCAVAVLGLALEAAALLGAAADAAGALVELDAGSLLEACADFVSSCCALACEVATAPWAFAIALESPWTPGAEPW